MSSCTICSLPCQAFIKKLNLLKLEDLYKVELGKFMYLFYDKKTPKFLIIFLTKLQKFTLTIQDKYLTVCFFYQECQKQVPKTQFRTKVQRFGQN